MSKSGLADSPFFTSSNRKSISPPPLSGKLPIERSEKETSKKIDDTVKPRNHDTVVSSNHDTTTPGLSDATVETVRKAVKKFGKEAATHRFTLEEKKKLSEIIFHYKGLGVKTSENEIARIAINFIFEDHKLNGKQGILERVLKVLNE